MNLISTLSLAFLASVVVAIFTPNAVAQIDLKDANAHGLTTAVTTTMRVQSEKSELVVTGKHELLRETLLLFIRNQGFEGLKVSFPKVQWPDGSESDPHHRGYTGELINGYYRFIQNDIKEAITANQNLEIAVDQMFKSVRITVPNSEPKSEQDGADQPGYRSGVEVGG